MNGLHIEVVSSEVIGQSESFDAVSDKVYYDWLSHKLCILTGCNDQAFLITIPSA